MSEAPSVPFRERLFLDGTLLSPNVALVATVLVLALVLTLPLTIPIGPFYWDLFIYFDAANRIFDGQVPVVDFLTPVGPLGYWLFAGAVRLFPDAQPLYLVSWSTLAVTAPLLAPVLREVDRTSRGMAFALLVPFLVFSILPFNVEQFYPYPGSDGYAIYNRQAAQLLYVLTAALVYLRGARMLLATVALGLLALFLLKITGFLAGLVLFACAVATGRLGLTAAGLVAAALAAALALLELTFGFTSAYIHEIVLLVELNQDHLLSRFPRTAAIHFSVIAPGLLLVAALLLAGRRALADSLRTLAAAPSLTNLSRLLDRDAVWLAAALFAGLGFETQNLGGQAFIFLWPLLLAILSRAYRFGGRTLIVVFALVAATALPNFMEVAGRAARTLAGQLHYVTLESDNLGTLGAVSFRPEAAERAAMYRETYLRFPALFQYVAGEGRLPTYNLYTEPEFQIAWLKAVNEGVSAIRRYEEREGVTFDTILSLNFTNPFPWLMGRSGPRYVPIGADPFRTVPDPGPRAIEAIRDTDLVLWPKCPITVANWTLRRLYRPALSEHRKVVLSDCWDGFVKQP